MVMDADLFQSFQDLCNSPARTDTEAESIMSLLADIILNELNTSNSEDCDLYCREFVNSLAFKRDPASSRAMIVNWLSESDLLHTQWMKFLGHVLYSDLHRCTTYLHAKETSLNTLTNVVWTYRYTQLGLVQTYLRILYEYFCHAQISVELLTNCISDNFIAYLYWLVCEKRDDNAEDYLLIRDSLTVLVALNDQYMLHDMRGSDNKVFHILETNATKYVELGGALVLAFNRCSEEDQDLKIFIAKFLFLVFSNDSTKDLLYTNDLAVLCGILLRELNDLAVDAVDIRAMYLRLLYVMTKNSTIGETSPKFRKMIIETLKLTLSNAEDIESEEDRKEVIRLTERCLTVEWLQNEPDKPNEDASAEKNNNEAPSSQDNSVQTNANVITTPTESPQKTRPRKPIPPPPPPPPRAWRKHSNNSSTSLESLNRVGHLRPPPPPQRKVARN